jgi:uncharacterized protein YjiS (DUF1127 family)
VLNALRDRAERRRELRHLRDLPDYLLADVGLGRDALSGPGARAQAQRPHHRGMQNAFSDK